MEIPKSIIFNGIEYRLMGAGKYYLSQSTSNEGRKGAKGLHVAVWEYYSGQKVPKGYEVHHIDGNPFNNDFSNLECVSPSEHRERHKESLDEYNKSQKQLDHLERIRPLAKEWHASEEGREWHKNHYEESLGKIEPTEHTCILCGKKFMSKYKYAKSNFKNKMQNTVRTTVKSNMPTKQRRTQKHENVSSVARNLKRLFTIQTLAKGKKAHRHAAEVVEENSYTETGKKKVYNITVEKDHLFYAGGFLVSNCDSTSQALNHMIYSKSELKSKTPVDIME